MAEVLVQFEDTVSGPDGRVYTARVCGRKADDGLWEGWIEFTPHGEGMVLRTPRESEQPKRSDLEYWATGLTAVYLEGALRRALRPALPDLRPRTVEARPVYDRPAPPHLDDAPASERAAHITRPHAVLNPFEIYAQGEDTLLDELRALNEGHLRTIIRAHDLVDEGELDLQAMHRPALVELIAAAVRKRVGSA
jgi:hypothetical protein